MPGATCGAKPVGEHLQVEEQRLVVVGRHVDARAAVGIVERGERVDSELVERAFVGASGEQPRVGPVAEVLDDGEAALEVDAVNSRRREAEAGEMPGDPRKAWKSGAGAASISSRGAPPPCRRK